MESDERPAAVQGVSADLLAAQARLLALRAERGIVPQDLRGFPKPLRSEDNNAPNWELRNATIALQQKRLLQQGAPGGADARPYPNAAAGAPSGRGKPPMVVSAPDPAGDLAGLPGPVRSTPTAIPVHPTLLLAVLRQHQEAAGRVWLLLRALDTDGRGWLAVDAARDRLARKDAPWRCCGWRRLRQILAQGEGIFWQRDDRGRLWLRGAHRVAYELDCERLQGFPVELPVQSLLGGIQAVRAAFYSTFHSGRDAKPISRETLRDLSGIAERTQRTYDRRARVTARRNLAVADRYSAGAHQERAWQRGRGVFYFVDAKGRQGRAGGEYVAWHLPNSYEGPHARRSRGGRKRLNRKLADLVNQGIPGNGERQIERVFWPDGAAAAKGFNRDPRADAYWGAATTHGPAVWQVLARLEKDGRK